MKTAVFKSLSERYGMKSKHNYKHFTLLCLSICSSIKAETCFLMSDFNVIEHWKEGMSWGEFNRIKNITERKSLIKYVDKIEQQKLAKDAGLEIPKTYVSSHEKTPFTEIISGLSSYVAKPSHLSWSEGIIIVKDGINMLTGNPITPDDVQESIFAALERKPRAGQAWALYQVQPGFLIQEYVPNRQEVKIQTVFGKAIIGEWRGGESKAPTTPVWARYNRDGKNIDGTIKAPEWWPQAIAAAEKMAVGTDALRVDLLVKENGTLVLSELEIWPESDWSSAEKDLMAAVDAGYRSLQKH